MKKKTNTINLTREQKDTAANLLKNYIEENFDNEVGNLQAQIFLDFITENIGIHYYNQAIADSMTFMNEKVEDLYLIMKEDK